MDFKIFDPSKNALREIPESNGVFLVLLKYSGQLFYFYSTEHVPDFSNFTIGKCVMPVVYRLYEQFEKTHLDSNPKWHCG